MEEPLGSQSGESRADADALERELTVAELAAEWDVSQVTIRRYIRQGRLRARGGGKGRGLGYRVLLRPGQTSPDAVEAAEPTEPTEPSPAAPPARPPAWSRARTSAPARARATGPATAVPPEVLAETAAAERHAAELIEMQRERRRQERENRERERRRQARREAEAAREAAEVAAREAEAAREAAAAQEAAAAREAPAAEPVAAPELATESPVEPEQEIATAAVVAPVARPEPVAEQPLPAAAVPPAAEGQPAAERAVLGRPVVLDDAQRHTLRRAEWWERGTEADPAYGCLTFLVELQSSDSIGLPVGREHFRLADQTGAEYEPFALRQPALSSIDLERSAWTRGWVTFWAPRGADSFELEYTPPRAERSIVYSIENPHRS